MFQFFSFFPTISLAYLLPLLPTVNTKSIHYLNHYRLGISCYLDNIRKNLTPIIGKNYIYIHKFYLMIEVLNL